MHGYRQSAENGLITNLNSISSSHSSIDTTGRRRNTANKRASHDNLINSRSTQSVANSTSLLWRNSKETDRYSTAASVRNATAAFAFANGSRCQGSEIYYNSRKKAYCPSSDGALNFVLVPLLLLTILRQVFDFLGQIWLQILINFFTIIFIIIALFGLRQNRISYLVAFSFWALFNTIWNLIVVCIYSRVREINLSENLLSLYVGTTSWWHTNGPGCMPPNGMQFSSIHSNLAALAQPSIAIACKVDYRLVESIQGALHALLSIISLILCCCVIVAVRRSPSYFIKKNNSKSNDRSYRMNTLTSSRAKINHDPFPTHENSRFGQNATTSLRRANAKASARGSQHSMSSVKSARRRSRQSVTEAGQIPTPRNSTNSMQRSQKYGSLSSRRSSANRRERRGEISSLTYGTTGDRSGSRQRTRLSSLSSADYLPSYQPPHSSNANLLSSYGEISSIDSYANNTGVNNNPVKSRLGTRTSVRGNTNPTYNGSRSSIYSQNANVNNYDDLSYIYGNGSSKNGQNVDSAYGASTSGVEQTRFKMQQQQKNDFTVRQDNQSVNASHEIQAETHRKPTRVLNHQNGYDTMDRGKMNGVTGSFQSFSAGPSQSRATLTKSKLLESNEVNNNDMPSSYQDAYEMKSQPNNSEVYDMRNKIEPSNNSNQFRQPTASNGTLNGGDNALNYSTSQVIYNNQRDPTRHPIYSNQLANGGPERSI